MIECERSTPPVEKINPLLEKLPIDTEREYTDYTDLNNPVTRQRCMQVGANETLICGIAAQQTFEPEPTPTAINQAIVQASLSGGGLVKPTSVGVLNMTDTPLQMQDNVVLDLDNIGSFNMLGSTFDRAVEVIEKQNFGITCLRVNGNNRNRVYAVRVEGSRNGIIQRVETENMDQDSISINHQNIDMTVRYTGLTPGRDEDGGGSSKNQHGIVNSSIPVNQPQNALGQLLEPAPSARFGIVYSYGHAYYSNIIQTTDALGIDSHASNLEVMGNSIRDTVFGVKLPHSSNVMFHHNRLWNGRAQDTSIQFRLYSANDYADGVGYEGDDVFVFENVFEDLKGFIRSDIGHGDKHFLNNTYINSPIMEFRVTDVENGLPPPADGTLYRWGGDLNLPVSYNAGATPSDVLDEPNTLLRNNDHVEMVRLMNLPKDTTWTANVAHPLPPVGAY